MEAAGTPKTGGAGWAGGDGTGCSGAFAGGGANGFLLPSAVPGPAALAVGLLGGGSAIEEVCGRGAVREKEEGTPGAGMNPRHPGEEFLFSLRPSRHETPHLHSALHFL